MQAKLVEHGQLATDAISLLGELGFLMDQFGSPNSPRERAAAINLGRKMVLAVIDFLMEEGTLEESGIDVNALAAIEQQSKDVESVVGRESWLGLLGIGHRLDEEQTLYFRQLGEAYAEFIRGLLKSIGDGISDPGPRREWEDSYETLLSEFTAKW